MDGHQWEAQVCILDHEGPVVLEQRIRTEPARFAAVLGARARTRIVLEASIESECGAGSPAASLPLRQWAERGRPGAGNASRSSRSPRRLAGMLFALWRDGTDFDAAHLTPQPAARGAAA